MHNQAHASSSAHPICAGETSQAAAHAPQNGEKGSANDDTAGPYSSVTFTIEDEEPLLDGTPDSTALPASTSATNATGNTGTMITLPQVTLPQVTTAQVICHNGNTATGNTATMVILPPITIAQREHPTGNTATWYHCMMGGTQAGGTHTPAQSCFVCAPVLSQKSSIGLGVLAHLHGPHSHSKHRNWGTMDCLVRVSNLKLWERALAMCVPAALRMAL